MIIQDLLPAFIVAFASGGLGALAIFLWQTYGNKAPGRKSLWFIWALPLPFIPLLGALKGMGFSGGIPTILPGLLILPVSAMVFRRVKFTKRKEALRRDLPTLLDSLVLNVAAGIALMPAFLTASKILSGKSPLREEIDLMKRDTELGTSHVEALARLQERISVPGADTALEALIQALTLGTPVERVLREQSRRMRENLILDGEQFANTLSVKLLAPLFLFILPASFLVILSPVIVALLENPSW